MVIPSPVIITQILTPKKRPDLLHRPRLVDFIHEHIDRKLLLISASAGYGKTSLLVDYVYDTDLPGQPSRTLAEGSIGAHHKFHHPNAPLAPSEAMPAS